jgi:hypothetical protein
MNASHVFFCVQGRLVLSNFFVPTLKEAPKDAHTISHKLLLRAGFIRQVPSFPNVPLCHQLVFRSLDNTRKSPSHPQLANTAGFYSYLPFAVRVLDKIERIIDEELQSIGGPPHTRLLPPIHASGNLMALITSRAYTCADYSVIPKPSKWEIPWGKRHGTHSLLSQAATKWTCR